MRCPTLIVGHRTAKTLATSRRYSTKRAWTRSTLARTALALLTITAGQVLRSGKRMLQLEAEELVRGLSGCTLCDLRSNCCVHLLPPNSRGTRVMQPSPSGDAYSPDHSSANLTRTEMVSVPYLVPCRSTTALHSCFRLHQPLGARSVSALAHRAGGSF